LIAAIPVAQTMMGAVRPVKSNVAWRLRRLTRLKQKRPFHPEEPLSALAADIQLNLR
jgi:hypothetical protein